MTNIPAPVIVLAILWTRLALADDPGRVKISGGWAGLGVGANRGDVLTCGGHEYPLSLAALSIGELGAAGSHCFRHGSRSQPTR